MLWNKKLGKAKKHLAMVEKRIVDYCGYRRVPPRDVPGGEDEVLVFVRK